MQPISNSHAVSQWLGGWLIESTALELLRAAVMSSDIPSHIAANPSPVSSSDYVQVKGSTAIVSISGVMMKARNSMTSGVSTVELRRELRSLQADSQIEKVVLHIESPGGTAAGTMELGEAVSALAKDKPVIAYIEDIGASAAYWVASQATKVYANKMAKVGSIGTYAVVADMSEAAAMQGIKVYVVRAGEFKGMGTPGTEISAEQIAELQRLIDGANEEFLNAVAAGRRMSIEEVMKLADGRVHLAEDALAMKLIDGIRTFDEAINEPLNTFNRRTSMATAKEITDACPGIVPEKVLEYLQSDKTLSECVTDYVQDIATELAVLKEQSANLEAAHNKQAELVESLRQQLEKAKSAPGLDPLIEDPTASATQYESPRAEWQQRIREKREQGLSSTAAAVAVSREFPGLREAMLDEANN